MDAIQLLESQHREVEALFEKYEEAKTLTSKSNLFAKLADVLAAHTTVEEKFLYPATYVGEMKDLLKEAVEEHLASKRVISDLLEMKVDDENFDAKVKVLQEQIEHHVEEEEEKLFPMTKKHFVKEELEAIGSKMESLYDELITSSPRHEIPNETSKAAPLT